MALGPVRGGMRLLLTFTTDQSWCEARWERVRHLFEPTFPESQRKSTAELMNLFSHRFYAMHAVWQGEVAVGMAFTARLPDLELLFIDYMAVAPDLRSRGIGAQLIHYLVGWAKDCRGMVGEVDAPDPGEPEQSEAHRRIAFYRNNGFACVPAGFSPGPHQRFSLIVRLFDTTAPMPDLALVLEQIRRVHRAARRPLP